MVVEIDGEAIVDWPSFHSTFQATFGFPKGYSPHMIAWAGCLMNLDDPRVQLTRFHLVRGQIVTIPVAHAESFKLRCPQQFAALLEAAAYVNWHRLDCGDPPILAVAMEFIV